MRRPRRPHRPRCDEQPACRLALVTDRAGAPGPPLPIKAMSTQPAATPRALPPVADHDPIALPPDIRARYDALSQAEKMRVCRLLAISGAPLVMAIAAVEALREERYP